MQTFKLHEKATGESKSTTYIWVILICCILFYVTLATFFILGICTTNAYYRRVEELFGYALAVSYILVGLAFPVVCHFFFRKYKVVYPILSSKSRLRIIINVSLISTIFTLRGVLVILRIKFELVRKFAEGDVASGNPRYPLINFTHYLIFSLVPSTIHVLMLRSLLFESNTRNMSRDSVRSSGFWNYVEASNDKLNKKNYQIQSLVES